MTKYQDSAHCDKPDAPGLAPDHQAPDHSNSTSDSFEWGQHALDGVGDIPLSNKRLSPVSPALTAPETPSPDTSVIDQQQPRQDLSYESEKSWREERELKGIHEPHFDDTDESSNDEADTSLRVREARILRLKKEAARRGRAHSHDPASRRRPSPSAMSSVVDKLDLQLIEVMRPLGAEYGPDECSM